MPLFFKSSAVMISAAIMEMECHIYFLSSAVMKKILCCYFSNLILLFCKSSAVMIKSGPVMFQKIERFFK